MKRIISILLTAALLLSAFSIPVFAEEKKPEPTVGPADSVSMYGGARCGVYNTTTEKYKYVVNYDYEEGALAVYNDELPGMTYDMDSNTLTVKDVDQADNELFVWYMGNDFKLKVEGECAFGVIDVYNYYNFYSTTLNITGSGTLTVNEKKRNDSAIQVFAMGSASLMGVDIADAVTVHLYAGDDAPVVSVNESAITPAQGGAITVGGKALPEAENEQIKQMRPDYVKTIEVDNRDKGFFHGYQVKRKSDPDGVYVFNIMDRVVYSVSRYIYVDALELWVIDDSFSYVQYKKDQFEAEYEYLYGVAPTPIEYMSDYLYERRGTEGVKMLKDGEPGAVYVGLPTGGVWDWDEDYPGNYEIHRVLWSDDQEMYVEDTGFKEIDLMAAQLADNGYQIAQDTVEEKKMLQVWDAEPSAGDRHMIDGYVMTREADPDGLYIKTGEYTTTTSDDEIIEEGIVIHKVHYDPEAEDHYIERSYDEPECFYIPDAAVESGDFGFTYDYDTIATAVMLHYLPKDYDIQSDMSGGAIQLKKTGEPDAVYAYRSWTHYFEDDTEREEYELMKLRFDNKLGVYVEDSSFDNVEFYDLSYLEENGYEIVQSEQLLQYSSEYNVYRNEYPVYTDNDGNTYYADYADNIYSYSEADAVVIGGTTYYLGVEKPELSVGDLNSTEHEVVTDKYKYWLDGPAYHHAGGEASDSYTVSGSITSYLTDDDVTVKLEGVDNDFTATVTGKTAYSIADVPAGAYTLSVAKDNHVTRNYEITVSGDTTQDVKICPKGDTNMNGKVQSNDATKAYKHLQGADEDKLTGYAFQCADVNGNGRVQSNDATQIYRQAQGEHNLF